MSEKLTDVPFNVGDSVRVKEGVEDVGGLDWDLAGKQGRVVKTYQGRDSPLVCVEWDSPTLESMPGSLIERCEEEGIGWMQYNFLPENLEPASARDTREDVSEAQDELIRQHAWVTLGDEGQYIQRVLRGASSSSQMDVLKAWEKDLSEKLTLPFEAVVAEFQERTAFRQGDRVRVMGFELLDDMYGLIAELRPHEKGTQIPLADLEASDETSPNYEPLRAYRVWFANS